MEENTMTESVTTESVVEFLQDVLANVTVFFAAAQRAHWNVRGTDFHQYHDLFGDVYDDVYGSIDPLAESIRKLGGFPKTLSAMLGAAVIQDDSTATAASDLASDLMAKNTMLVEMYKKAFDLANAANEQGIADFCASRIDMHQKWDWQLSSSVVAPSLVEDTTLETPVAEDETPASVVAETTADLQVEDSAIATELEQEQTEEVMITDSVEAPSKELGKKLDVSTIEDSVDTTAESWTSTERRIASRYKELRNHDINKAETYLIDQIRSGFVSRKFNPLEVKA
jgi:starvation-inducible DNA-binding protein